MADLTLTAQPRDLTGKKVGRLRRAGLLPAVVYGPALPGPRSIQLDYKQFEAIYSAAGLTKLITLTIGDSDRGQPVFIRDVQYNLLRRRIDHVDFYAARMDTETTATVPVVLVGEAPVVARGEGVISQVLASVTVRALPQAIPAHLEADARRIETINDDVRVADLSLPPGVTVVEPPDAIVVSVTRAALAEAVAPAEAVEAAAPAAEATEETGES
jgi:large subunit ribosomal protein L25